MTPGSVAARAGRSLSLARTLASVAAAVCGLAACGHGGGRASDATSTTRARPPASTTTTPGPITATTGAPESCLSTNEIDSWSVARRVTQLVTLPALDFDVHALAPLIRNGIGGLLFLGTATPPPDLRQQLAQAGAAAGGPGGAPLVMADVEGGGIQRLPGAVEAFPWARDMAATQSAAEVQALATTVGRQMLAAGVSVDLAPVVDLDDRPGPSTTNPDGLRSFSIDPATTSAYGVAFMQGLRAAGVLPVVKHFPGLGGSTSNTDFGPAATLPYADLQAAGLKPFVAAIAAHAPAIMVANAYVPDLTTLPSSLSSAVIHDLLRGRLGFSGLVVTDSLSAGAIVAAGYSVPKAAAAAIEAGADLVLFGSTLTPADTQLLSPANVAATESAIVAAVSAAVASARCRPHASTTPFATCWLRNASPPAEGQARTGLQNPVLPSCP